MNFAKTQYLLKNNSPCSIREAVSAEIQPLCAERSWWWIDHLNLFFQRKKCFPNVIPISYSKVTNSHFLLQQMRILRCLREILEFTLWNVENRSGRTSIGQFPQRLSANRPLKIGFSEKLSIFKVYQKICWFDVEQVAEITKCYRGVGPKTEISERMGRGGSWARTKNIHLWRIKKEPL